MENCSKVYFTDLRCHAGHNLLDKLQELITAAGMSKRIDFNDKFTAVKLHFGEPGNMSILRPGYVQTIVRILNSLGAKTFLADSNTLYKGFRDNAPDHLRSASANGFNLLAVDAPVVIADGIKGTQYTLMDVPGGVMCKQAKIGSAFAEADIIISVSHFKGHEQAGFGGTLKNLGMGCASIEGKHFLHSDSKPRISGACVGCGLCVKHCAHDALSLVEGHACIDYDKCAGCGQCVATCRIGAAVSNCDSSLEDLNFKIAEYAAALVTAKPSFHISFVMNVSPECDCWAYNDAAIVPDLGIAASFDPVALDQACADMVINAPCSQGSNVIIDRIHGGCDDHHGDKFAIMHPDTCWEAAVEHAAALGIGTRKYELVKI